MKLLLSEYDDPNVIRGQANIIERETIEASDKWNLRPFFYMEDIPECKEEMIYLNRSIIEERNEKIDPREEPDRKFNILEISQNGVFLSDQLFGYEFTQAYKIVRAGDLAYNPYRINIGSIGLIPSHFDRTLVSPAYIVFHSIHKDYPAAYIQAILKSSRYMLVIMNYSLSSARANLPFSELLRIKIPKPKQEDINNLQKIEKLLDNCHTETNKVQKSMEEYIKKYLSK